MTTWYWVAQFSKDKYRIEEREGEYLLFVNEHPSFT